MRKVGVDDWLVAQAFSLNTWEALERLPLDDPRLNQLAAWAQGWRRQQAYAAPDDRPELDCDPGDLAALSSKGWAIVTACNHPETLYRRGTVPVRLEPDDEGRARLVELTPDRLRHALAAMARCTKAKRSPFGGVFGREDCPPPLDMVRNMLADPEIPLPPLGAIVEVPVLSEAGLLIQHAGYDQESQVLYRPYDPTVPITIPANPTCEDLAWARTIIDEVLGDFPFASDADRTHCVGLMVLPFVRPGIKGPTPNHSVEASGPGAGKTLLVGAVLGPAVGRNVGIIAEARDEDEMRKRITARLLDGCTVTVFDNITRAMDSGVISAALTATQWEDRRLGKSETVRLPLSTIWVMTGNNPIFSMELARRTIPIRLDPQVDRPWLRTGFRHADLRHWVEQERATVIRAILTIVQGWLKAGRPTSTAKPLGSFEAWSAIIGGILQFAGYENFLANILKFYETADTDGATWRTFTTLWWDAHRDRTVTVKDLFPIAESLDGLNLGKAANERGQRSALGRQLRKRRDQVIGVYRVEEAGTSNNAALWRLRVIASQAAMNPHPPPPSTEECDLYVD